MDVQCVEHGMESDNGAVDDNQVLDPQPLCRPPPPPRVGASTLHKTASPVKGGLSVHHRHDASFAASLRSQMLNLQNVLCTLTGC